jgi:Rieske 2Fe-2S family protein
MSIDAPEPSPNRLERTLPSSYYHDPDIWRLERERIFAREWICACREDVLAEPGARLAIELAGESILLTRDREGKLHGFYNVCRHRGAQLCKTGGQAGTSGPIRCPYHSWAYGLDGKLLSAPHLESLAKEAFSLYPVGVESWGGFVFVHLTPVEAKPLAEQLGGVPERLVRYPLDALKVGWAIEYDVAANWKIIAENYNECYHCAGVHPELCDLVPAFRSQGGAGLDWERGIPHRDGAYTFTDSGTTSRAPFPGLDQDELTRHKGELVYPNLLLSLSCDHVAAFLLFPEGPERTRITCLFLFTEQEMAKESFDASDAADFWDLVNKQDWAICESVQRGTGSRAHDHGYYAPMEDWNLDIRRYVLNRILID